MSVSKSPHNLFAIRENTAIEGAESLSLQSQRSHRSIAFQVLYAMDRSDYLGSLDSFLETFNEYYRLEIKKNDLAYQICSGILSSQDELLDIINSKLQNWSLDRISCSVLILLKMALWEMKNCPETLPAIVIDEYVELSKFYCEDKSFQIINGILDVYSKAMQS